MGGLIFIIIVTIANVAVGIKLGIDLVVDELYMSHRINITEKDYMKTWKYFIQLIKNDI